MHAELTESYRLPYHMHLCLQNPAKRTMAIQQFLIDIVMYSSHCFLVTIFLMKYETSYYNSR